MQIAARAIPFVRQMTATDCGAACLAMVLGACGASIALAKLRDEVSSERDGSTVLDLVRGAARYGLKLRGVVVENADFKQMKCGSILHLEQGHYVVFLKAKNAAVRVADPESGCHWVATSDLRSRFSGVALLIEGFEHTNAAVGTAPKSSLYRGAFVHRWHALALIVVQSLLLQVIGLSVPMALALITEWSVKGQPLLDGGVMLVVISYIAVTRFVLSYVRGRVTAAVHAQIDEHVTATVMRHLMSLPLRYFVARSPGDLLVRLNSTVAVRELLSSFIIVGIIDGVMILGYLVILVVISPPVAAVVAGLAAVRAIIGISQRGAVQRAMGDLLVKNGRAQGLQVYILHAIESIKATGAERCLGEAWDAKYREVVGAVVARANLSARMAAQYDSLGVISPLVLVVLAGQLVASGSLGVGEMMAVYALGTAFLMPVGTLVSMFVQLSEVGSHVERLRDIIDEPPEQLHAGLRHRPSGAICVDNVHFRYSAVSDYCLRGISFVVPEGAKVAIVGQSGSGKSTLGRILLGTYMPDEGTVAYDGVDVRALDLQELRRHVGVVVQREQVLEGSIRHNLIAHRPQVTEGDIEYAVEISGLASDLHALPMGLDTHLGGNGAGLSGGQIQRLALARALVSRPKILLLDEATNSMDQISEKRAMGMLARERCTQIVISHRLSLISGADLIVVLSMGQIVGAGSHAELWAQCEEYRALMKAGLTEMTDGGFPDANSGTR